MNNSDGASLQCISFSLCDSIIIVCHHRRVGRCRRLRRRFATLLHSDLQALQHDLWNYIRKFAILVLVA
ncbi:hypothetical protein BLOT_000191 [Blomia tropicalis]|nr:hypothetical protein BLOT_000191 [Blomia tropicalis]